MYRPDVWFRMMSIYLEEDGLGGVSGLSCRRLRVSMRNVDRK